MSMTFPADATRGGTVASVAEVPSILEGCVLLAEDNDELAAAQVVLLRSAGLDVERANRGDAAAELAEQDGAPFDVVLSDIVMPGPIDGVQLALRLRLSRPGLPVILMTGYATTVDEATAAGFVVLSKPVEPAVLFAELARALGRPRTALTTELPSLAK